MNIEPIIQSEVSQKEKDKYRMLMHLYGAWKDGTDEAICRAAGQTQTQRTDCGQSGGRGGWGELGEWCRNMYITVCKIRHLVGICYMIQGAQIQRSVTT